MAREKTLRVRLSEKEWERLESEATKRETTMSQLVRYLLKKLEDGEIS